MDYISDRVGEEYKSWTPDHPVLIMTPTGSGKTYFVFNVLLPYAKSQNMHIAYFCNRRFIKEQTSADLELYAQQNIQSDLKDFIHIRSYQRAEKSGEFPEIKSIEDKEYVEKYGSHEDTKDSKCILDRGVESSEILYYVFDEAHYFCTDATFNEGTHNWLDKFTYYFNEYENKGSICVFLTATPEPLFVFFKMIMMKKSERDEFFIAAAKDIKKLNKINHMDEDKKEEGLFKYDSDFYQLYNSMNSAKCILDEYKEDIWPTPAEYFGFHAARDERKETEEVYIWYKGEYEKKKTQLLEMLVRPLTKISKQITQVINNPTTLFSPIYKTEKTLFDEYDYINVCYCENDNLILDKVTEDINIHPSDKWLVFVESKEQGKKYKEYLMEKHCSTVFLNADIMNTYNGTVNKRSSLEKKTIHEIVTQKRFTCNVVIATSVLDCGVTLHAEDVKNIVICQYSKHSFLQMLGRIRVKKEQKINLIVKSFSRKHISGLNRKNLDDLIFLILSLLKDKRKQNGEYHDRNSEAQKNESLYLLDELRKNDRIKYMISCSDFVPTKRERFEDASEELFDQYRVNELAMLQLVMIMHEEYVANENFPDDSLYYLKQQLTWIGKSYDISCWLEIKYFNNFLSNCSNRASRMFKDDELYVQLNDLFDMCLKAARIKIGTYAEERNDPDSNKRLSRMDKINIGLQRFGLNYEIKSGIDYQNNRKTFWYVIEKGDKKSSTIQP